MTLKSVVAPEDVVSFWKEAGPEMWFAKDDGFDARFRERFLEAHFAAARRELENWSETATGSLALMLLLDQFPRNCFRNTGHMYATDSLARMFTERALERGQDIETETALRVFFYLPFTHSEELAYQERACLLNEPLGGLSLHHAVEHRDIIARFGRFPHRNGILGRETTSEEKAYLEEGGFSG